MKLFYPLFLFSLVIIHGFSQGNENARKFAKTISAQDIKAHISFLADDLVEGRETGERGQKIAGLYVKSQFVRMGLPGGVPESGSYYQTFYLNQSGVNEATISLGKKTFNFKEDFTYYGMGLPAQLSGDIVFGGYGLSSDTYNNFRHTDVKDKLVLVFSGSPVTTGGEPLRLLDQLREWRRRGETYKAAGAKAFMIILPDSVFETVKRFAGRGSMSITGEPTASMAGLYLSETMGNYLLGLGKGKPENLKKELETSDIPATLDFKKAGFSLNADVETSVKSGENVLAYLEGTDKKEELLVLTAHYDHIGVSRNGEVNNGADDDASGTSSIMEIAEAFALAAVEGYRPRRSILFMLVSGEEKGLLGSEFYTNNPLYPLASTVVNLNIDMIGRIDSKYESLPDSANYTYVIGSDRLSSELHALSEEVNQTYSGLIMDYKYNADNDPQRFYYRSDHYNFAKNGIPVIFYFSGTHKDYHKPTDDLEKINFEKTAKIARQVFYTAWEIANREEKIVVDKAVDR
ncbi:MAG: M28 family peptidase [Bacteroidia bacterium]|nr:M28 family peptidase [Bacteroidia bacterium]